MKRVMQWVAVFVLFVTAGFAAVPLSQRGTWTDTGAMLPRARPQLIKLADGRIIVIGNTEIQRFDPSTDGFTTVASDQYNRSFTASTMLQDGRILITGGVLASPAVDATACSIYDPATNNVTATGAFVVESRSNHQATLLPSGNVLVSGGGPNGSSKFTTEVYNPVSGTWSGGPNMVQGRTRHTAIARADGTVVMIGGNPFTTVIESCSVAANACTAIANMAVPRQNAVVVRLLDGRYLIAGGTSQTHIDVFDPATNAVTTIGHLVNAYGANFQIIPAGALLPDGRVLIGGFYGGGTGDQATPEIINPSTGRSTTVRRLQHPRDVVSAITLNDGRILFAGGTGLTTAETFTHTVPGWTRGDFELNVRGDVWWHDPVARLNKLWSFNGVSAAGRDMPPPPLNNELLGIGDFDGNKLSDVVYRDAGNNVSFWPFVPGDGIVGTTTYVRVADYKLLFTADADGDGVDDLVWRSQSTGSVDIDFIRRAQAVGVATYGQPAGLGWELQAADDLNGDDRADLVWRNTVTGENKVWFLDGGTIQQDIDLIPIADQSYQIRGTGDFNGDTLGDLVWRNDATGDTVIWLMNGGSPNGAYIQQLPNANWRLGVIADFDSDGKSDIFWRNPASGENMVWLMDTFAIKASSSLPAVTGNWTVYGP